jgi:hypothetical protein
VQKRFVFLRTATAAQREKQFDGRSSSSLGTSIFIEYSSKRIEFFSHPLLEQTKLAMSRGDQRDRDRAKRQAKEAAKSKGSSREGTPLQRNQDDAAKLQAKIAAKAAKKAQEETNDVTASKEPAPRKKVPKKSDNLDDLLSAGLGGAKKTRK